MRSALKDCQFYGSPAALVDKDSIIRFGASLVGHASATDSMDEHEVIAWIKPQYDEWFSAIAPPAAGSVDKDSLDEALDGWVTPSGALYRKIVAWGAQQREAGKAEQTAFLKECMVLGQDEFNRKWLEQKERAEKAEAEYKIVCDKNDTLRKYCEAAQETEEKWQGKAKKAEARVKELEAEDLAMHRKLAAETLRADQGWARYEAATRAKNDLEREKVMPSCDCHQCKPLYFNNRMILCATCGNKRCPHANDHRNACTGSNEPGQVGSAYA